MSTFMALTIIADDRPGIVEKLAEQIRSNGGNWLESKMSRLAGKFAGILLVSVSPEQQQQLSASLQQLEAEGIKVIIEASQALLSPATDVHTLKLVTNDRPGIVEELSSLFAKHHINVEELTTWCESAPMSADQLFNAKITVVTPNELDEDELFALLESLSDDLVVEPENG